MATGTFQAKTGEEVLIRPVRPEDAPALYEAARHPDVARMILLTPALELDATREFVEADEPNRHYLVAELDGRAIGSCTLDKSQNPRLAHSGRLGIIVHRDYWGQGIGSLLMQAILGIADDWLNLQRVELDVFTENEAAIHLYEKFGFEKEGRRRRYAFGDGGWMDNLVMARLRDVDLEAVDLSPAHAAGTAPDDAAPAIDRSLLTIRPLHPDDVEPFYQLMRMPTVARTTLQIPSQEIGRIEELVENRRPGTYRLVADLDGQLIGNLALILDQNPARSHAASLGMAVHPHYWGQGIGSTLMEAAVDLADNWLNITRIELDVNVDNPAGVRLYRKFGFSVEGTRRFHVYGDGRWAHSHFMARLKE
jgi:putative acetyltransferase